MDRRQFVALLAGSALGLDAKGAFAGPSPFDQLDLLIPGFAGGGADQTGRAIAECLLAAGLVEGVAVANADGAVPGVSRFIEDFRGRGNALMVTGVVAIGALMASRSPLDLGAVVPIARLTAEYQVVLVPAGSPRPTLALLIAAWQADPAAVTWMGGSQGGADHIFVGMLARACGIPPRGIAYRPRHGKDMVAALLAGEAACAVSGWSEMEPHIASGRLLPLAVSARQRIPGVNVPTLIEQGIEVDLANWRGVFAPPGISAADRTGLIDLMERLVSEIAWKAKLFERNWTGVFLTGDAFGEFVRSETARVRQALDSLGLN